MISKKILALVLAISVIVCALPAFSVSAAESVWPDADETLENISAYFNNGIAFDISSASDALKASATNGTANAGGMKVSGTVSFGDEVINLNKFTIRGANAAGNLTGWGSDFVCHDPEFTARLAASDAPGLERDDSGNVIISSSGSAGKSTIRNFVRYILNAQGVDYSDPEVFTDDTIMYKHIDATSATLTFHPYTSTFFNGYPEGSLFLPTTTDYLKQAVTSDYKVSNNMYVPATENAGISPFAIYKINQAGEYKVWLLKRDQNTVTTQRDIYLDINGQTFAFTGTEGAPAAVNNDYYYMSPEDSGKTVTVKAGEELYMEVNNKTSVWSGSFGILLVPTDVAASAEITGTERSKMESVGGFIDCQNRGLVEYIVPEVKKVNVTIGDTELEVASNVAETWYPATSRIDADGHYIYDVTLLDVVVAAAEAKIELPFELVQELTSDKVTPITYEATVASGNPWPTNSNGNGYNHLWAGTEIFCTNSSTPYSIDVKAPKAGNYYMFTYGGSWEKRWLSFTVNGATVYEKEGDSQFYYNNENTKTVVVAQVPVALNEGANTVTIKANGGWMRCSYVGFIEAASYEEAVATAAEITTTKEAFNNYFAVKGSIYAGGKVSGFTGALSVNGNLYASNFEFVKVADGAVIVGIDEFNATNFAPISLGKSVAGFGGRWNTDLMYSLTEDYSSKFITNGLILPIDSIEFDALAGCYLNGYLTISADFAGQQSSGTTMDNTTGDDTIVKIYLRDLKIRHSKGNGSRLEFGINGSDCVTWGREIVSADIDGDGVDETYRGSLKSGGSAMFDFSNLYVTNSQSAAPVKVTATAKGEGVYQLTSNKSVPVCFVKVTKVDGVVTETTIENTFIDFTDYDGIEVTVADNQTIYVWEGTVLPVGSTMVPLCAPLTK